MYVRELVGVNKYNQIIVIQLLSKQVILSVYVTNGLQIINIGETLRLLLRHNGLQTVVTNIQHRGDGTIIIEAQWVSNNQHRGDVTIIIETQWVTNCSYK